MTWDDFLIHQKQLIPIYQWENGKDPDEPIQKECTADDFVSQLKSGKIDLKEYMKSIVQNRIKKINVSEEEKQREVERVKNEYRLLIRR